VSTTAPSRKQARRDALFLLYQREVTSRSLSELVDDHRRREGYAPDDFTIAAVRGVIERQDDLDAVLARHSTNWPLERLAPLERSVLRLALFEIESGTTPPEVAIDEAVRLTRRYATDEAGALVNGILGGVVREREEAGGDAGAAPDEDDHAEGTRHG
jgi:transcription antitermination protein NusB